MCKLTLTGLALPLFLLFASPPASAPRTFGAMKETTESQVHGGTLQKMIVESGTVTMPFEKAPWGDTFGMFIDRFGTSWLINAAGSQPG